MAAWLLSFSSSRVCLVLSATGCAAFDDEQPSLAICRIFNEFLPYKTPEQPRLSFKQTGPDYRSSLYNCVETELTENFAFFVRLKPLANGHMSGR